MSDTTPPVEPAAATTHHVDNTENSEFDALEVGTTATAVTKGRSRIPWRFLGGRAAFYVFTLRAPTCALTGTRCGLKQKCVRLRVR